MGRRPLSGSLVRLGAIMSGALLVFAMLMSRGDSSNDADAALPTGVPQAVTARPEAVVVRARSAADLDAVSALATSLGYAVATRAEEPPSLFVEIPAGVSLSHAVTDFTAKPGVLYVEPAFTYSLADVPADPLYATQQRDYLEKMAAPQAWDITTGNSNIVVAVLDTGLDTTHPDLQGRILRNPVEIPGNGVDEDRNGCIDDVDGCSFLVGPDPSCGPLAPGAVTDDVGHGTFVSGIIAASGNGAGMVGVARNALVLPVKILDCKGSGNTFGLAQGILYAASRGARILNVSLGGPIDSAYVREAIRLARVNHGALLIAATGNNGSGVSYPAKYDNVLAVGGATAAGNARAGFSNSGPEVDVVAIGQGIIGTVPPNGCGFFNCLEDSPQYGFGDGTSFAAPLVSGLAALMLSRNPYLSAEALDSIIRNTADPMPASDRPDWAGAGRINMLRALQLPFRIGAPASSKN